jgi:hypothetical protein
MLGRLLAALAVAAPLAACASAAVTSAEATPEHGPAAVCGAYAHPPGAYDGLDVRYMASVEAVVDEVVECANGEKRLVLTVRKGDFHGSFVGHVISRRDQNGEIILHPEKDARSRADVARVKVGDTVAVTMDLYPSLHPDGTLAYPGASETIRIVDR